jgi:hypothetical protein
MHVVVHVYAKNVGVKIAEDNENREPKDCAQPDHIALLSLALNQIILLREIMHQSINTLYVNRQRGKH